jgi:hypothetical protein
MRIHKIIMEPEGRMIRFGFGKNKGRWFARVDLWTIGYRLAFYGNKNDH